MRGVHTYAILLGFAIGVASFIALRLPPLSVVLAIASTIAINEGMKRKAIEDARRRQERLDRDEDL